MFARLSLPWEECGKTRLVMDSSSAFSDSNRVWNPKQATKKIRISDMTYWKQCMNYSQKPKKSCLGITSPISSLEPNASSSLVLNFAAAPDSFFCLCLAIHAALSLPPFSDCLLIQFDKGEAQRRDLKWERVKEGALR